MDSPLEGMSDEEIEKRKRGIASLSNFVENLTLIRDHLDHIDPEVVRDALDVTILIFQKGLVGSQMMIDVELMTRIPREGDHDGAGN